MPNPRSTHGNIPFALKDEIANLRSQLEEQSKRRQEYEAELNALRKENAKQAMLLRHSINAVFITDHKGEIEWVNDIFTMQTGLSQNEIIGRNLVTIVTDPDSSRLISEKIEAGELTESDIIIHRTEGEYLWVNLRIEPVWENGTLINFAGTLVDITENKEQAQNLDGSKQNYRRLYETSRDALMSLGEVGIFDCNEATIKLFGYDSREEFCALHPTDFSPEYQPNGRRSEIMAAEVISKAMENGCCCFDWVHKRKDGSTFNAEVLLSRYNIQTGPVIQASVRDISERKAAEIALIEAKKAAEESNQIKSDFLANMSHEIRTPLNAMLGFTELLKRGEHTDGDKSEFLELISSSGDHLLGLINDILDLSKVESGKMEFETEPCSIWSLVEDVYGALKVQADHKKLTLKAIATTPLPTEVTTDSIRLRQLVTNLVGNALKFTSKGEVKLLVSYIDKPGNRHLILECHDTGIGIADDDLKQLFVPFHQSDSSITRRFGGTGLGLSISQRIAKGLGGKIEVESEPGKGSIFRFTLPCHDHATMFEPEPLSSEQSRKGRSDLATKLQPNLEEKQIGDSKDCHILLCEDIEANRILIQCLLKKFGCRFTSVENGELGVEAIKRAPDAYDLILMDIQMPLMDGYTATGKIRELGYEAPIIALTAHAMQGTDERCLQAGFTGYLTKPIDIDQLRAVIGKMLAACNK